MGTDRCNTVSRFPRIPRMVLIFTWTEPYLDILLVSGEACFLLLSVTCEQTPEKQSQVRETVERRTTWNVSNLVSLIAGLEALFFFLIQIYGILWAFFFSSLHFLWNRCSFPENVPLTVSFQWYHIMPCLNSLSLHCVAFFVLEVWGFHKDCLILLCTPANLVVVI